MACRAEARRAKVGPRGRTCTCNLSVLSGTPLHWATRGGAHGRICTDTRRVLSALPLRWATWALQNAEFRMRNAEYVETSFRSFILHSALPILRSSNAAACTL